MMIRLQLGAALLLAGLLAASAQPANPELGRKIEEYTRARQAFDAKASVYWSSIIEKRRARFAKRRSQQAVVAEDYVLTHPPVYAGPPKPIDPSVPPEERPPRR